MADLRLWLGEQNVCLHLRGAQSVDHLTISLYPLVEGLVHNWWTLFGGRDASQSLLGYRGGYAVPDIRMSYDGVTFEYVARQRIYTNPDIRFWSCAPVLTTRIDAEAQLSSFIEHVLDRLREQGVANTSAAQRWARVQASRFDADEAAFCESAGALRLDPYQIDDARAATIERASALFDGECLTELLAGAPVANCGALIEWIGEVESRADDMSRIAGLQDAAEQAAARAPDHAAEPAWARGYRRARAVRQVFGFDSTRRFATYAHLGAAVGASRYQLAPSVNGIRLLRSHKGEEVHLHMRTHGRSAEAEASHLFTFARGIGDVACFPTPQRSPVNELRSAYRQATGRAFAAEFLAPVREVLSMHDDGRDVVSIAEAFAVSTEVIDRQIGNAARIEYVCRPDETGEAGGAVGKVPQEC